jgi:pimeloyl-ACP methyl ester carboxylesterase
MAAGVQYPRMPRRDQFVTIDGRELHYSEWGSREDPPVVCVHGLSRVGRDFDPIAAILEDDYHVLCLDMPGRGMSEWADLPMEEYTGASMADRCVTFCDEHGLEQLRWIGTSMGGMIGIELAGGGLEDRITHLVLNDVGPAAAADEEADEGIERIIEYLTNPPAFDRLSDLEGYYRETYEPFSEMSDAEWRRFTTTSYRRNEAGEFMPAYDTSVVEPLLMEDPPIAQWDKWENIDVPTLVLKGAHSDILAEATFEEMQSRRPEIETRTYDCGHAPALNVPDQTDPIVSILNQ